VIVLLLAPRFLRLRWIELATIIVLAAVLQALFVPGDLMPMQTVVRRLPRDRPILAPLAGTVLLLLTPTKITQIFSSRYMAMALPLLILVTDRYTWPNYWRLGRLALGAGLGLMSLTSYFSLASGHA
jgi:hypothetical protein